MRQNERAADCFLRAANIWSENEEGRIMKAEEMEKLGILLGEEGDVLAAHDYLVQAKDICLHMEFTRRDEKHLRQLSDRIMAYAVRIGKLQEEKRQG